MPVILPVTVLFSSFGALVFIVSRRMHLFRTTLRIQKDLESHQRKLNRAKKKEKNERVKAVKELERASALKHKALRNLGAINDLMKKADQDIIAGNDEEALKTLIQIISLDGNHRKANELLAKLYLRMEKFKKAELIYKKLVEQHPFDPEYYASLGESFYQRRQFKASTRYYEEALNLDKNNPQRYISLGNVHLTKKDYSGALEYYLKAHRLNVRDVELMFLIVETCLNNIDPITAREYLHKILDYEPYNQQAKSLLGEVLRDLKEEA
jgi:tetratricopeptide (TPR) repeat protein